MIKNVIQSIARANSKKAYNAISRKSWLSEQTLSENASTRFNPRRARNKSVKGLNILAKEI